jgi:hypothetical protein
MEDEFDKEDEDAQTVIRRMDSVLDIKTAMATALTQLESIES